MAKSLDVLAFGAHPDDVELCCGATVAKMVHQGYRVGVIDLTQGELGSRGNAEIRAKEAGKASEILGLEVRENLKFRDGFFQNDENHQLPIIAAIRRYQPRLLLIPARHDRHPDHGRASQLVRDAAFLSGLRKIETSDEDGSAQEAWRPEKQYFYIQDHALEPQIVVNVEGFFEKKLEALRAYSSQFYNPAHDEPETYISSEKFWHFVEARARDMGHRAGFVLGEGFQSERPIAVDNL